jgi:PAS domain S-box-containing protein
MKRLRISLAAKALGLQVLAVLAIAAVVAVPRYYAVRDALHDAIGTSAENLLQVLEDLVNERPELLQPGALDAVIDRFTRKLPAVAGVSVLAPDGRVLADSRVDVGRFTNDSAMLPLLHEMGQRREYVDIAGHPFLRRARSLRGRYDAARRSDIVAAASVDMRLALTNAAAARELASEMALEILLLFPIGAALYVFTRRAFVRPLEQLAAAGAQFARGEVPTPLAFAGQDELAGVARTFNEMVEARASALKERERQLREAQAIAHVGSWEFDMVANRVTWSDEAYRLWGLPLGSPVDYQAFIAGVHPDDRPRVEQLVGQSVAKRRNIEYECRIIRPDGDVRHLLNRNVVVTNGGGQPIRLAGTCLDITELKRTEERLRASMAEVKVLQGILPICASCKRIRTDGGEWEAVESYVRERTDAEFTHGLCPDCAKKTWG